MTPLRNIGRGQALVEAALGTLVLVTVLVFAIAFGEVVYVALKLQEGAASAMWDSTARRHHRPRLNGLGAISPLGGGLAGQTNAASAASAADATQRYSDLDGRSSVTGGNVSYVFTQVISGSVQVTCDIDADISHRPGGFFGGALYLAMGFRQVFPENEGEACTASGAFQPIRIPQELGPWFRFPQIPGAQLAPRRICGVGRPVSQDCTQSRFSTVIDDWGLSGRSESQFCYLMPDDNPILNGTVYSLPSLALCQSPLRGMANILFETSSMAFGFPPLGGRGGASAIVNRYTGRLPNGFSENRFWISAPGEELTDYQQVTGVRLVNPMTGLGAGLATDFGRPFSLPIFRTAMQPFLPNIHPSTPGGSIYNPTVPVMLVPNAYLQSERNRTECFLGQACNEPAPWWGGRPAG
ncbi:MAG: TadE family protein [Myxococcaceae bacterium]